MNSSSLNGHGPKIVVIGGGSGSSNLLRGLKNHTPNLTAIVTMFDSGGSSGLLSKEYGLPPFGDLRQCLLALADPSEETKAIHEALDFRFGEDSSLNGHSVGNLVMAALTSISNDLEKTIEDISKFLHVKGDVIPVTLESSELCAEMKDGQTIRGESNIDRRGTALPRIERIFIEPQVNANPRALQAIIDADAIVMGPGDLYTSVIPNLLPNGITKALGASSALRIYVCNLMTKLGETDDFKASDFLKEIINYSGRTKPDWIIVNTDVPEDEIMKAYDSEGARLVAPDIEIVSKLVPGVVSSSLATTGLPLRHDEQRTASTILQLVETGSLFHGPIADTVLQQPAHGAQIASSAD